MCVKGRQSGGERCEERRGVCGMCRDGEGGEGEGGVRCGGGGGG